MNNIFLIKDKNVTVVSISLALIYLSMNMRHVVNKRQLYGDSRTSRF